MSYNQGYGQGGQGYGQYNPYGEQNPYTDNNAQGGYGSQQQGYGQNSYGQYQDERTQGGYEMGTMGSQASDPNRILNEVRQIDQEIDGLEAATERLRGLQNLFLDSTDATSESTSKGQVEDLTATLLTNYRGLVLRMNTLKQKPESGNPRNSAQVGKVNRRLKESLNKLQQLESNYRREQHDQLARQYRIVRPDASDQEIRELEESADTQQIFSQAMMSSDRRQELQSTAEKVKSRHKNIQKIERDVIMIAQLQNDLAAAVAQQDVAVNQIETKANETATDVEHAAVQLDGAAEKARAARKKKWICTGIVVLIIIIIVIVVAVAVTLTRNSSNNNNPR